MLTPRIEAIRQNYVNAKPEISTQRAKIWTDSHKATEGKPVAIRRAQAFYDCCDRLEVHIFDGELVEDDLFLALYRALIELIPSYEIRGEKPVYDESQKVEVHYQFWDGTEETFTFYKLDDFYYVIQMEEDVWFACDYERFQRVEERIADLMAAVGK